MKKIVKLFGLFKVEHKNTVLALIEQLVRIIVNFIVSIWLVRYMGAEEYGIYSYAITVVTIFLILSKFGINDLLIKRLCESKKEEKILLLNSIIAFKIFISFLSFLIFSIFLLAVFDSEDVKLYLLIASLALLFQGFDLIECKYQADIKIKPIVYSKNLQLIFSSVFKVFGIYLELDISYFVCIFSFEFLLISIFYLTVYVLIDKNNFSWKYDFLEVKSFFYNVWPLAIANIAIISFVRVDQIMIFHLLGAESLGLYSAVVKLSEAWYFVPTIIATMYFSKVLEAKDVSIDEYETYIKRLLKIQILISLVVGVGVSFLSDFIIVSAYGVEFTEAILVLQLHIWAGIFISINRVSVKWHVSEGYEKKYMKKSVIGLITNIILNLFLIPLFGISGAAIATLISLFVVEIVYYKFSNYGKPFYSLIFSSFRY